MKIGKVSQNPLKRSILQQIKSKHRNVLVGAGLGEDCAIFSYKKGICLRENDESVIISCITEGSGPVLFWLTDGMNRLAAKGAEPIGAGLQILLPKDSEEADLKNIVAEAESFCSKYNIQLAQASARVSGGVKVPMVTVVSYGLAKEGASYHGVKEAAPGQDIVVSKWIGLQGSALLANAYREEILKRYPKWICDEAESFTQHLSVAKEAAAAIKSGVCAILNVSEGGILASLWELAEGAGVGLTIDLKKLPIRQETVEICNHLNVNPYELWSGGCLLMTAADGQGLVDALAAEGIVAAIVGRTTDSNDRLILNEDEVRYLDRPHPDSLYEKIVD